MNLFELMINFIDYELSTYTGYFKFSALNSNNEAIECEGVEWLLEIIISGWVNNGAFRTS